ncbi:hypothetical protein SUGI_0338950 [Cryptomeria japonica]|nr:hypothetical protein SUGI_0338950 [Cryptomeria japonica]
MMRVVLGEDRDFRVSLAVTSSRLGFSPPSGSDNKQVGVLMRRWKYPHSSKKKSPSADRTFCHEVEVLIVDLDSKWNSSLAGRSFQHQGRGFDHQVEVTESKSDFSLAIGNVSKQPTGNAPKVVGLLEGHWKWLREAGRGFRVSLEVVMKKCVDLGGH